MNQDRIIEGLGSHLDSLKQTIGWALLLSVAFAWAGLTQADPVKALGIEVSRNNAFVVAVIFYVFVNAKVLDLLLRIGDLMSLLDDEHLAEGLTRVAVHSFIANPFSYFGSSFFARAHSAKGFGLLIVVWWIANSSLFTLANGQTLSTQALMGVFLAVGLGSMLAISRGYSIIIERVKSVDTQLYEILHATRVERSLLTFVGIIGGGFIAFLIIGASNLLGG